MKPSLKYLSTFFTKLANFESFRVLHIFISRSQLVYDVLRQRLSCYNEETPKYRLMGQLRPRAIHLTQVHHPPYLCCQNWIATNLRQAISL